MARFVLFPHQIGIKRGSKLSPMPCVTGSTESVMTKRRSLVLVDGFRSRLRNPSTSGVRICLAEIGLRRIAIGPG